MNAPAKGYYSRYSSMDAQHSPCRLLAQMRSADRVQKCLLLGVDQTYCGNRETDANDPKPTFTTDIWARKACRFVDGDKFPQMK